VSCHRTSETQTKRDAATLVPRLTTFIKGLRGAPSDSAGVKVVDLTLSVGGHALPAKAGKTNSLAGGNGGERAQPLKSSTSTNVQ